MPRWDGTGPRGMGPMSGRGMGYCRRDSYRGRGMGYSLGYGPRYGRAGGGGFFPCSPGEEKAILENEKRFLEARLVEVEQVLKEFDEE